MNQRCQIQCWFRISAVGYSANSESALSDTALSPNQRCIWQRWLLQRRNDKVKQTFENWYQCCPIQRLFQISAVSYSADSESALLDTSLILNQRCIIQRWFWISVVGYIADSESALYDTALIRVLNILNDDKYLKIYNNKIFFNNLC
jgi:hypothetical protein